MSSDSECENAIGSGKSGKKPGRRTRRTGNDCITPVALAADIQIKQELPEGS